VLICAANDRTVSMLLPWRKNGGAVGGNVQIRGWVYYNKIPFLRHKGSEAERLVFFTCLQRRAYQNNVTGLAFFTFLGW